ncbi:MAG: hypothetical protein IAG13_23905 [Deltaproteobacteria bacterium]|nr:hypothetical protein [Nannocystaceae bacterium]
MPRSPRMRRIAIVGAVVLALLVAGVAWLLRVEDIPDELPAVQGDPRAVTIPPVGAQPPLELAALAGKTAVFVVISPQNFREGRALNHALHRWSLPPQTVAYVVGDVEGMGAFSAQIAEGMERLADEMRYPVYADFEGVFARTFGLPKGHHGFVVLGPDGTVLERRSGGAEAAELERIRVLLGAEEPAPGPAAPEFSVGGLDRESCSQGTPCALVFLAHAVARKDVPKIPGGYDGDDEGRRERMLDPSIRLVATVMAAKLERARGVLVGRVNDLELPRGWQQVDDDAALRTSFGVGAQEAGIVIIDGNGLVAVDERGLVPLYKRDRVADVIGVDFEKPADEDDDDDE